jgi:iron-only hydrogenase group A
MSRIPHKDHNLTLRSQKASHKILVAQVAPSVRVAIGEPFGMRPIRPTQLVTSIKHLGFDYVFDTLFSADVTIMEEGTELLTRFKKGELQTLPMFTSCCPGWVQLAESSYPELLDHLSTTKSPQQIMGAIVKNYWVEKQGIRPEDVYMVSFMPCIKKQGEADRAHINTHPHTKDVDLVITTAELAKILHDNAIDLPTLSDTPFDNPHGFGSGGGVIFGRSGGVMLSALRFAYEALTHTTLNDADIHWQPNEVLPSVKEAIINIPSQSLSLKVAVVLGLADAKQYVKALKAGKVHHHFVEVMGCVPGGCISGGGQPPIGKNQGLIQLRKDAINNFDDISKVKAAHKNPFIAELYDSYLDTPMSEKAHDLLHTHYELKIKDQ